MPPSLSMASRADRHIAPHECGMHEVEQLLSSGIDPAVQLFRDSACPQLLSIYLYALRRVRACIAIDADRKRARHDQIHTYGMVRKGGGWPRIRTQDCADRKAEERAHPASSAPCPHGPDPLAQNSAPTPGPARQRERPRWPAALVPSSSRTRHPRPYRRIVRARGLVPPVLTSPNTALPMRACVLERERAWCCRCVYLSVCMQPCSFGRSMRMGFSVEAGLL